MTSNTHHTLPDILEDPFIITLTDEQKQAEVVSMMTEMRQAVMGIVPSTEFAHKQITTIYARAREWKKAVEDTRKRLNEKPRHEITYNNDRAKLLSEPLDEIIEIANAKAAEYQMMLDDRKAIEDAKVLFAAAIFDMQDEVYMPQPKTTIRGDGAMTITKTETRFEVVDALKVPARYLMVNEAAIKADIKLGVTDIPGVRIYEEKITQLRTR